MTLGSLSVTPRDDCFKILEDYHKENVRATSAKKFERMTIDIGANEVAYKFLNTTIGHVGGVYNTFYVLSKSGIDPSSFCYDSKQASIFRHDKKSGIV